MCGILGLFCLSGFGQYSQDFVRAGEVIKHRGPDGEGCVLLNVRDQKIRQPFWLNHISDVLNVNLDGIELALGHRRLAIIDLTPSGIQPMKNKDGTLWIVYNGEIYNYRELRAELEKAGYEFVSRSDTEVILHAYAEWGEACVQFFNGMWAFALLDLREKKLFCSRDRFGIKPFYYYADASFFVFGSEIKQLVQFPFIHRRINEVAIYEYLAYGAVDHDEQTFFCGIKRLMQGHNLVLNLNENVCRPVLYSYYQPVFEIDNQISAEGAAAQMRKLLADSVRLHLRSDVAVGSCLSGGVDSSILVSLMQRSLAEESKEQRLFTFSAHFEEKEANELEYMQAVIQSVGSNARFTYPRAEELLRDIERLVWHQDEPFGSTSIFAQWSVFKLVKENGIKVVLDGQGPDEILGGYIPLKIYYLSELRKKRLYWEYLRELYWNMRFYPNDWQAMALPVRWRKRRKASAPGEPVQWINSDLERLCAGKGSFLDYETLKPFGENEDLNNALYRLTFFTSLQALLRYEDRNSMAFSVESRVPYLDYRLVEFAFRLPSYLKMRDGYTKRVLRDAAENLIPDKVRWRTSKLGFSTPETVWQKGALKDLVRDAVYDTRLKDFILPDQALAYQENVEKTGRRDFASWRWINLSVWMRVYQT